MRIVRKDNTELTHLQANHITDSIEKIKDLNIKLYESIIQASEKDGRL